MNDPKQPSKPEDDNAANDNTGSGDASGKNKGSVPEVGGRGGLDPVRYGDWEIGGRCVDF
jgi:hypothetical protein